MDIQNLSVENYEDTSTFPTSNNIEKIIPEENAPNPYRGFRIFLTVILLLAVAFLVYVFASVAGSPMGGLVLLVYGFPVMVVVGVVGLLLFVMNILSIHKKRKLNDTPGQRTVTLSMAIGMVFLGWILFIVGYFIFSIVGF